MGGATVDAAGDYGRVAEGAGPVAVPGAHLLFSGHNAANSRGGTTLPNRRQKLESCDEALRQEP